MLRRAVAVALQLLLLQLMMLGGQECVVGNGRVSATVHDMAATTGHTSDMMGHHAHGASHESGALPADSSRPHAPASCLMAASCASIAMGPTSIDFDSRVVTVEQVAHADVSRPRSASRAPEPPPPRG